MGTIPKELRETIARNIRDCRINKFPAPPNTGSSFDGIAGMDFPPPPFWEPAPPGSAASFFWLIHHFVKVLETHGFRIDKQSLDYLAKLIK